MNPYRVDQYDNVYELDGKAYIFIGKLNGQTLEDFLIDYEG